jgi:hypothetical protein
MVLHRHIICSRIRQILLVGLMILPITACTNTGNGGTTSGGGGTGGPSGGGGNNGPVGKQSSNFARIGRIQVVNKGTQTGVGIAEVVVPLAQGAFTTAPNLRTELNKVCQVFPMGARHPDGSIRYLRLEVPVYSAPEQRQSITLNHTVDQQPGFLRHGAVSGITGIQAKFLASGDLVEFPQPALIEGGPLSQTFRSRLRVPQSMMWAELLITLYSELPHAKFTLQWGNSDPRTTQLSEDPGNVELQISGATVEFEFEAAKILSKFNSGSTTHAVLHTVGKLADGQSQLIEGRLIFAGDSPPRLYAISEDWQSTGSFGPFGHLLPNLKVNPNDFDELVASNEAKHKDHPWSWPVHGCNPSPSSTGSQRDFASSVMRSDVLLADPARIRTILRSVYQESCRTSHHREIDVRPVLAHNHPNLLTLTGRPKYEGKNPDMLGKLKNVWVTEMMRSPEGQRWKPHDGQHLSINYLGAIALLTGNRFARAEIENHCMLYLTGFTYKTGSYNDSPGASRQVGRSSLAAIWMYQVSGREEIKTRVINRAKELKERMATHTLPFTVMSPRSSNTRWYGWEEGVGTSGLAAIYQRFGTPEVLDMIHDVSRSIVMHGYGKLADGRWRIGYQIPFLDIHSNTYVALNDPNFPNIAAGSGLTLWGMSGVILAAASHPDPSVQAHAKTILTDKWAGPIDGLDQALDWICVVPTADALAGMTSAY